MMKLFKRRTKDEWPFCSVVVVAAGSSQRMGFDKMFVTIGGMPAMALTLSALQKSPCIHEIIVVTQSDKIVDIAKMCRDYGIVKATKILCGGSTRVESSLAGLSEISPKAKLVAIHDGARPLVSQEVIEAAVKAAMNHNAAAPAIPVKDTVKIVDDGVVCETPDRSTTMAIQTPQVFVPELIKGALTYALQNDLEITDDCSAVEALGVKVYLSAGSEENIKLTTPLDVDLARTIFDSIGRNSY